MIKRYLVHITAILFAAALYQSAAQESVEVSFTGLGQLIEVREDDNGVLQRHLRHRNALPSQDPLRPYDRLLVSGEAPKNTIPHATIDVQRWIEVMKVDQGLPQIPSANARISGTKAWQPIYAATINPWKTEDGSLWLADSLTVRVTFQHRSVIEQKDPVVPSVSNAMIDAAAPTVKLTTHIDGIALQTGSEIGAVESRLLGQPLANLALFYKNDEQPMHVVDVDSDGMLSSSDRIVFRGRRPEGDTSWLDWDDTVAVYFLTVVEDGVRKRFSVNNDAPSGEKIASLNVHRRIELDTGFYHLGNASDPIFAEYNSDRVWLEGFYWDALNANGFERMTYRFPFAPASTGSFEVTAHYVAATDALGYNPDTRADLTVNALHRSEVTSDSIGQYSVTVQTTTELTPHGVQSIKLYSTGIDEHRGEPGYFSEVLLDWFELTADAAPVLEDGRLHAGVEASTIAHQVEFVNASASNGFAMDTLNETIAVMSKTDDATVVRFGLSTQDHRWILLPLDERLWHGSVIVDSAMIDIDSISDIVLVHRVNNTLQSTTLASGNLVSALNALSNENPFALFNSGVETPSDVRMAMQNLGLSVPTQKTWAQGGVIGAEISVQSTNNSTDILGDMVVNRSTSTSNILSANIPSGPARSIFFADETGMEIAKVLPSNLINLADVTDQVDVLIVTHSSHREQAERLAEHRKRHSNVSTRVVDIDAILDEFGAGHRSAEALRNYLAYSYANSALPRMQWVILVGNATWDQRMVVKGGNVGARRADQVPTFGRPSSDYYFGLLDDPTDYAVPEVIVGRLPGLLPSDVKNHVDKIISNDTSTIAPYMRKFLFVGGGSEVEGLCALYEDMLSDPFETGVTFTDPPLCLDTLTLCKYKAPPNAGFFIRQGIDAGLGWMNYIGHGSTEVFDITGWEPKDLTNKGRYGVLATYACQTGSYSNPSVECKNSQYLTVADAGFAAAVGGTGWAFKLTINFLHFNVHQTMRNTQQRNIGDIVYSAKLPFAQAGDQNGINTAMQYCILGDPLMRVHIDTVLEAYIRDREITVTNAAGTSELTDEEDVAIISVPVHSAGIGTDIPIPVWLIRTYDGFTDTVKTKISGLCLSEGVQFEVPIKAMKGEHRATVIVDPYMILGDDPRDNTSTFVFTVLPRSLLPVHPLPHMVVDAKDIHIRLLDPLSEAGKPLTVHIVIANSRELSSETTILKSIPEQIERDETIIDWRVDLGSQPLPAGPYWLHAWTVDSETQEQSAPLSFAVAVAEERVASDSSTMVASELHTSPQPEHVTFDEASNRYELASIQKDVFLRSSGIRTQDPTIDPVLEMKIGDVLYVSNPYFRGFNIVVVNEVDTIPTAIRRYDTYRWPLPIDGGHNGFSADLLKFLQDSIAPNDRVLISIAFESLTGIIDDGNLDSLRVLLKGLGSAYADSLDANSSWALIGQQGLAPGEAPEGWKGAPDSMVTMTSPIPFYSSSGVVRTPWIGPIRELESIDVQRSGRGVSTIVEGRSRTGEVTTVGVLKPGQDTWTPGNEETSTFVRVVHTLTYQPNDTSSVFVSETHGKYTPADEWVVDIESLSIDPDDVLRGDTAVGTISVKSANVYRATQPTQASIVLATEDGEERSRQLEPIPAIEPNQTVEVNANIASTLGASTSVVYAVVNEQGFTSELYDFNNQSDAPMSVSDDEIPPVITSYADSIDVTNGSYVQPSPALEVRVYDNSKLPINDIDNMTVFVNGDRIREGVTRGFVFMPTDSVRKYYTDEDLRAVMTFEYDLEPGQNNLLVRALDATGNEAELLSELWVSTTTDIGGVSASPNPSNGPVRFSVDLRSPSRESESTLKIFDATGRLIRSIQATLRTGTATIEWDGMGSNGESLPSGAYFYRLDVLGSPSTGAAGTSGAVMILR